VAGIPTASIATSTPETVAAQLLQLGQDVVAGGDVDGVRRAELT
jgi:hypothetical protein